MSKIDKSDRNMLVENYLHLIDTYIKTNRNLIQYCEVSEEDVRQEASVIMIEALDRYAPNCHGNLKRYLKKEIGRAVYAVTAPNKRIGISDVPRDIKIDMLPLERIPDDMHVFSGASILVSQLLCENMSCLPDEQQDAINELLYNDGEYENNNSLDRARQYIQGRIDELGINIVPEREEHYIYA